MRPMRPERASRAAVPAYVKQPKIIESPQISRFPKSFSFFYPLLLIFAANFRTGMNLCSVKSLLVAVSSIIWLSLPVTAPAQEMAHPEATHQETHENGSFDPGKIIMEHIGDSHDFHFIDLESGPVSIPLPVIVYSPQRGFSLFSSARFEHGHADYEGYRLENKKIVAVNEAGSVDETVKVYDFSITKNVAQMIFVMFLLILLVTSAASKYKKNGNGVAPSGFQNALEPVVTFIRDDVAKVNLGRSYAKYMPYLLTVFFFILLNSLVGMLPGSANVSGNIAFTLVLGVISFLVILFSSNKYYWSHIFNPHVPLFVKPILIPVEFLSIFTKPFALIIRLFANMVAGHIVITCFIMLIFIFGSMSALAGWGFIPVSLLFSVFIFVIDLLIAFIQAFIFTNLTAVFIGQAIEGAHDGANSGHEDDVIL